MRQIQNREMWEDRGGLAEVSAKEECEGSGSRGER